jgi:hypothetical protein
MAISRHHPQVQQLIRTGPVSRLVRVVLAGLLGATVYGLVRTGIRSFSDPEVLAEPGFWLITIIAVQNVYGLPAQLAGPRWGWRVLVGFLVVAAVTAIVAVGTSGTPWAAPLTWLLYPLELVILSVVALAFVVSALLGRPGCEMGVLGELAARRRGADDPEEPPAASCVVGLHRLDAWEARQRWHQRAGRP